MHKKRLYFNLYNLLFVGVDGFEPPTLPIVSECFETAELNLSFCNQILNVFTTLLRFDI